MKQQITVQPSSTPQIVEVEIPLNIVITGRTIIEPCEECPECPPPTNSSPMVSAGVDQTIKLPVNSVTLTGQASDSDGVIVTKQWTKVSGGSSTITTPGSFTTSVTGLVEGNYEFKFTVTDDKGATVSDNTTVTVQKADALPPTGINYLTLPTSAPRVYTGQSNLVIENLRFKNIAGVALRLDGCTNVTVRNCFFDSVRDEAVDIENSSNITVQNCLFNYVASGVYALSSSNIKVLNNQAINVHMKPGGTSRGQLVQFNSVGGTTNEIVDNRSQSWDNEGNPEDHISLYNTSNVTVRGNLLRGGGPSTSGSGIISGDNGGTNQLIENNILHTTGNVGIGVAGGSNIRVQGNKIYSPRTAVSNNPLYMWAQAGAACSGNTIINNRVNWTDKNGSLNGGWNAGNCSSSTYVPATDSTLTEAALGFPSHLITFLTTTELVQVRANRSY